MKMPSFGTIVGGISVGAVAVIAAVYLGNIQSEPELAYADATDQTLVAQGKAVYKAECASCHGANLEGQPNWRSRLPDGRLPAPPHDETGHTWHHADQLLFATTKHGGAKNAPPGFVSGMPGFGEKLSDREIWAALAYIKSRWPEPVRQRQAMINERMRGRN
jgi:mono/diheme cytochrome c family protein